MLTVYVAHEAWEPITPHVGATPNRGSPWPHAWESIAQNRRAIAKHGSPSPQLKGESICPTQMVAVHIGTTPHSLVMDTNRKHVGNEEEHLGRRTWGVCALAKIARLKAGCKMVGYPMAQLIDAVWFGEAHTEPLLKKNYLVN